MADVVEQHPKLKLVGAADLNPMLRARFEASTGIAADLDADVLLRRDDIDVVYIATPHQYHAQHVLTACAQGKHVVVEKPMALSLDECDQMIDAAARAGVALVIGHTHGFDPAVAEMRRLIDSGEVGPAAHITSINYTNFIYRPRRPEELDPAKGGGVVWNQVPHQIDAVRLIARAPIRSVRAATAILDPTRPAPGLSSAMLLFEGGAVAQLIYSGYDRFDTDEWHDWIGGSGNRRQPAFGAAHRALADAGDAELADRIDRYGFGGAVFRDVEYLAQPHFGELLVSCTDADLRPSADGVFVFDRDGRRENILSRQFDRPGHAAVWDELMAVAEGRRPALRDGDFARQTVATCLALIRSAAENREVTISEIALGTIS